MCSCWAAQLPSSVTAVHWSFQMRKRGEPRTKMGSIVKVWPSCILPGSLLRWGSTAGGAWKACAESA